MFGLIRCSVFWGGGYVDGSFLKSSLDRRCFEFIVSPKEVVGCKDGNQNVEGCWGSLT